jgi:hypothetical protein
MSKTAQQAPPPVAPRKKRSVQDVYDRLVRVESRLVKLLLAAGLDSEGNPRRTAK